jgi:SNF2 family DNA or RNA helicase
MNVDGYTYIIYDKFAKNHSYNNPLTNSITLDKLLESDAETIEGIEAIKNYNSYASDTHKIKDALDYTFYKILLFKFKETNISILVVGVSHKLLSEQINNIPNKKFLLDACSCHISYSKNGTVLSQLTYDKKLDHLTLISNGSNTDITDQIIENPTFTKINLFDYQRKTVKWMYDKEKNIQKISYSNNDEIFFGEYVCDTVRKELISVKNRKSVEFFGGLLADEVGLGKTFQTIALSLSNPPCKLNYFSPELKRLQSRATLIICPNQLCNQWVREITKTIKEDYNVITIPMMTKVHFDKYTYMDILDADFVVVSFNFLGNDSYYKSWLKEQDTHCKKGINFIQNSSNIGQVNTILEKIYDNLSENPLKLFETNPVLNCINFQRIICDEFHEIYTVPKYNYLKTIIQLISGNYKWCVTGTPFNKGICAEKMVEYVTKYKIQDITKIFMNESVYNYITKQFFRRNTKQSIRTEYKLEPYDEKVILMKLSPTERAIYSAYLANPNINRFSVLVRQLCNDPRLAEEIKFNISTCKTPEDIEKMMVTHYQNAASHALEKVNIIKYSISKLLRKITVTQYKRCRKFQRQLGNKVKIEFPPKIYDPKFEKKIQEEDNNDINDDDSDESDDDDDNNDKLTNKKLVIINNNTFDDLNNQVKAKLVKNPSVTLEKFYKLHEDYKLKLDVVTREYQGKRGTCEFFTNMLNKLTKLKSGEELDEEDKDNCPICLNEITGDDVGVTKCGHLFCYECIKVNIVKQPKCPTCTKPITPSDVFIISYEKQKISDNKDTKDKQDLINKIGTKLANLVLFLKSNKGKSIVFSQWDDMLHRTGEVLNAHGIKNVFCKGNVWTRDKAIRAFTFQEDVKVIMLSSESAAAGTNLTAAENVILLDAIYKDDTVVDLNNMMVNKTNGIGSYEYRRNMEWQAIGRAYRMGQTKKVSVVRFIMKDTVEEEIYKINKEEDKKFKDNINLIDKMIEMNDDNINVSKEDIKKMAENVTKYNNEKKGKKIPKTYVNKKYIPGDLYDDESDSEGDSDDD